MRVVNPPALDLIGLAMSRPNTPAVCLIGFGEAGQAFASGLKEAGVTTLSAWDILFLEAQGGKLRAAAAKIGVRVAKSAQEAIAGSDIVLAAVTLKDALCPAAFVRLCGCAVIFGATGVTVMLTVATALLVVPSLTRKVKLSAPLKFVFGV